VKKTTEDSSRRGKEAKQEEEALLLDFPRELSKTRTLLRRFCLWLLSSSSRRRSERLQIGDPGRKKGVKKERKKEREKEGKNVAKPGNLGRSADRARCSHAKWYQMHLQHLCCSCRKLVVCVVFSPLFSSG
jgi:hypothetical protein